MAGECVLEFLPQGVRLLGNLAAYLLAQGVELLRQTLFPGVQLCLQIAPCGMLGPEGEDAEQRRGQGDLLVFRKPCVTQLLHGHLRVNGDWQRLPLGGPLWSVGRDGLRSLKRFGHRICLTEQGLITPSCRSSPCAHDIPQYCVG